MSVVVQCFHCNAILELDDGFRGGVCRCSACGSLLQVPRGDDAAPAGPKVRPAMPPPPTAAVTPLQNATSSKLDVGLSRGQFDGSSPRFRQPDLGGSSGLQRVHRTKPITQTDRPTPAPPAPPSPPTPPTPPESPAAAPPTSAAPRASAAARSRTLLWLALILVILAVGALATMFIYYLYFLPET